MVMVCTDAAARGLDIPGLSHVVQADFAASAVDFIHRVRPLELRITVNVVPDQQTCCKHCDRWQLSESEKYER